MGLSDHISDRVAASKAFREFLACKEDLYKVYEEHGAERFFEAFYQVFQEQTPEGRDAIIGRMTELRAQLAWRPGDPYP